MAETDNSGPFEPDLDHTSVGKCCECLHHSLMLMNTLNGSIHSHFPAGGWLFLCPKEVLAGV